jgi:chemotaxis protein MotB
MVEPSRRTRLAFWLGLGWVVFLPGCGLVPRARVDDCHKLTQTLRSENDRLKDTELSLRAQNQDLTQRAVDDARKLGLQEEALQRLERSVLSYQDERDKMALAFQRLKSEIQASVNPLSGALLERFEGFAETHPGCEFDRGSAVLTIASDRLFAPGSDRLTPEARGMLRDYAKLLGEPEARALRLLVVGHTDTAPVRRASVDDKPARSSHLSLDRATAVRDLLAASSPLDRSRISVAGYEDSQPRGEGPDEATRARNRRIEFRLHLPEASESEPRDRAPKPSIPGKPGSPTDPHPAFGQPLPKGG